MFAYIIRRILATIPVMAVVAIFVFALLYLSPGDPAAIIAGDTATVEDIARIRAKLGLDQPVYIQFGTWVWRLLHGDLGISIFTNLPVMKLIEQRLEPTVALSVATLIVSIAVAIPLGVLAAWNAGTWIDRLVMVFAVIGFSVPVFVLAYILIYVFAIRLDVLPVQGYVSITQGFWPFLSHIILPSIALGMIFAALIARITRASMLDVLAQDYIRTAQAKGLQRTGVDWPCAEKRRGADRHDHRDRHRAVDRRRRRHRDGVCHPRPRAIDGRRHPQARLPDHPGRHPHLLGRLRAREPAGRFELYAPRPAHPVLGARAMAIIQSDLALPTAERARESGVRRYVRRHPTIVVGSALLLAMTVMAVFAPYLGTVDPQALAPIRRLKWPSAQYWFGTDMLGRDVYSRTIYGARVSLIVGLGVALFSTALGLAIGVVAGFTRWVDAIVMRIMDGLMSIPAVLIAIALMALTRASLQNVIFAITVAEVPRVTRLVRGVVLTLREQPYVEAAIASGTGFYRTLWRHIVPNTMAPLLVQGTYIAASAMITEAILSFIGAGTPPNIPSWGNIMAEGRSLFQVAYYIVLFPGIMLSLTVLAINLLGDGLRDALDPRLARRL